jgi:hypothetical protein
MAQAPGSKSIMFLMRHSRFDACAICRHDSEAMREHIERDQGLRPRDMREMKRRGAGVNKGSYYLINYLKILPMDI